jgi:hypothetical protein
MTAFDLHADAFALETRGDYDKAGVRFREALLAFREFLSASETILLLRRRASLFLKDLEQVESVTARLLAALPDWLADVHIERFCESHDGRNQQRARMHWQLVELAAGLAVSAPAAYLERVRMKIRARFRITSEIAEQSVDEAEEVLVRGERLLRIDTNNDALRAFLVEQYLGLIRRAMDRMTPERPETKSFTALERLSPQKRHRLTIRLRTTVRRLRRHLWYVRSGPQMDPSLALDGFQCLVRYYVAAGDVEAAIRMNRRARRVSLDDQDLRAQARRLRRMRR